MNPETYTDELNEEVHHEELMCNNASYALGWTKGLAHIDDVSNYTEQIDKLEQQARLSEACINRLKTKIEELELPWYIKLWNKIPKFSLSIRRTN